jgi:hypothetical protein
VNQPTVRLTTVTDGSPVHSVSVRARAVSKTSLISVRYAAGTWRSNASVSSTGSATSTVPAESSVPYWGRELSVRWFREEPTTRFAHSW